MEANTLIFLRGERFQKFKVSLSSNPGIMIERVVKQSICETKKRKSWGSCGALPMPLDISSAVHLDLSKTHSRVSDSRGPAPPSPLLARSPEISKPLQPHLARRTRTAPLRPATRGRSDTFLKRSSLQVISSRAQQTPLRESDYHAFLWQRNVPAHQSYYILQGNLVWSPAANIVYPQEGIWIKDEELGLIIWIVSVARWLSLTLGSMGVGSNGQHLWAGVSMETKKEHELRRVDWHTRNLSSVLSLNLGKRMEKQKTERTLLSWASVPSCCVCRALWGIHVWGVTILEFTTEARGGEELRPGSHTSEVGASLCSQL